MPYYVYVVKLNESVLNKGKFSGANPNHNPSKPCLYVGSSALPPLERYKRHLDGKAGSKWVKEFHIGLYDKYTGNQPVYPTRRDAERAEFLLAKRLRKKGFAVWTNFPAMPRFYKTTHFSVDTWSHVPEQFAIITGYATTGETWSDRKNASADHRLSAKLAGICDWTNRITGYSPATGHREPGWAAAIGFESVCDLGMRFKQDAVYWVDGDKLYASYCDARRILVPIGNFSVRLHRAPQSHENEEIN